MAAIKSIPLSLCDCEDKLFWPNSPDGKYIVSSAYRLLMADDDRETPSPSDLTPIKRIWRAFGAFVSQIELKPCYGERD